MRNRAVVLGVIILGVMLSRFVIGRGYSVMGGLSDKKTYICTNEISSIQIQGITGEIIVQRGNVDHVKLNYYERKDDPVYRIRESKGVLFVEQEKKFSFFHFDFFRYSMTVTVPGDLEGDLSVSNKSGQVQISNLSADEVKISNITGGVSLDQVRSGSDLTVDNTTGSITLTDVAAEGDVDVNNTTGKIEADHLKSEGNMNLKTVTGSITGTICGKESDYSISARVVTGKNSLSNSDRGNKKLKVNATTGSIQLSFTQP